jgi:hypothetical protein
MNRVSALWHLQAIDQELDDNNKRVREIDDALANDPAVTAARAAFEAEQKKLAETRSTLKERELYAATLDAKITESEKRLYSGRITNPKELDGLQKDLQMHKRHRSELDDTLLALMDAVEETQQRVAEKEQAREKAEATRADDVARWTRERDALTARATALEAERAETRASLDADALRSYDNLRRAKAGRAVAQIKNDSCSACGVAVPTGLIHRVRAGDEIVPCPSCGRILAA